MLKTVSSITNAIGALNFKGTWDANANSPVLTSSVGTKGDYYVVGTAGSTNLNGISNWGVGDLATFNGSVWQRVEGGADLNGVNLSVSGTSTLSGLTASTALALNASKEIVSVTNTGTGNNVLATSPTMVTPTLGVAVATSINKVALTAPATGSTLTIAEGKTLTANNSLTLVGTDATTMTFPTTTATIARTDAANSFTGDQTLSTGNLILGTSGKGVAYPVTSGGSALSPAFSAYRSGANQALVTATLTKVQLNTEEFDTNSNFDITTNYRFTPTVAGYYQISGSVGLTGTNTRILCAIYKNGSEYFRGIDASVNLSQVNVSGLVYFNGTTDYIELFVFATFAGTSDITSGQKYTFLTGSLVRGA